MQAEVSLNVTAREIERKVVEAALTYETKLREMAKWRPDSVEHFREAAELADRHYRLGAVPISTYVELQKQYLEAVESLLDTKKEALEAAQQLELLTGLPPPLASTSRRRKRNESIHRRTCAALAAAAAAAGWVAGAKPCECDARGSNG